MPVVAAETIPAAPGAYIVFMRLDEGLPIDIKKFSGRVLSPGRYAYCGSAKGPGGLRARLGRHLWADKSLRWHVDRLTAAADIHAIHVRPGGGECDLVSVLIARGATAPIKGFGSSDCRRCEAHLLSLPADFAWPAREGWIELGRTAAGPL